MIGIGQKKKGMTKPEIGSHPKASCRVRGCPAVFEPINESETCGLCPRCLQDYREMKELIESKVENSCSVEAAKYVGELIEDAKLPADKLVKVQDYYRELCQRYAQEWYNPSLCANPTSV